MELGTKVKFNQSLSKQTGYYVNYERMTEEEEKQLNENGCINVIRYKPRKHKEKQGFICGRRNITTAALLELELDDPYRDAHLVQTQVKFETVYVVACDMRGLYRVREEDLEVIA